MRKVLSALAALAFALGAGAQVNVELVLDQEQFLRSESLPIRLKISNFSGQTLRLGDQPDWLNFTIEAQEGKPLSKTGDIPLPKPFAVESAKTATLRTDLMPHFDLSEPGHYTIRARIKVPQLEKELSTATRRFDIVTGTKLWEKEVGMPGTQPLVVRKFALQQANFLKQLRLYVRVTDAAESKVIRVLPIGTLLSFSAPEPLIDQSSHLHVLFQNGPRSFLYSVIAPDGEQILRQTFDQTTTRPRLRAEEDGRVAVRGGARRILLSDLPPPRVAQTNETVESR
jgi:hypothetical protein